ncbi:alanine racemase [Megasphaera vaginalis (ex Bordigoni et al. 2020)]|uniref:alanine racemase n=1 Tax=Megasphaera vaginalis (ex Bordigoni et al. 2020) TaxID=2045301 RepID=UPI000C7C06AB|nr:alanine racemase [Megasphaera vaginalis (ex Bordigoni et al. 2020)]
MGQSFIRDHAPCYIYDQACITARCLQLKAALPGLSVLYSVKANPYPPVVKAVLSQVFGADAASVREVELALSQGAASDRIFYSSPGKSDEDICRVWGKCVFVADSLGEVERLAAAAAARREILSIGLRIQPQRSFDGGLAGPSPFGIDEKLLPQLAAIVKQWPQVRITGIHVHLRSQVLDAVRIGAYYRACYELAERVSVLFGVALQYINFGSGIGVVYGSGTEAPVDFSVLAAAVSDICARNAAALQAKLYIESGRFLTCTAGTYYTPIIDKKTCGGKTYLVVQNALNGFLRPVIARFVRQLAQDAEPAGMEPLFTTYDSSRVFLLSDVKEMERVTVVGNLCTALDILCEDVVLPKAAAGDILAFSHAGSYGRTLSPLFFSSAGDVGEYLV